MLTVIADTSESECSLASLIFKNLKSTIHLRRTQRQKRVMQVIKTGYHHFLSAKYQCKQDMALKSFIQDILQILERKNMLMKKPGSVYSLLHTMSFELPEALSQDGHIKEVGHCFLPILSMTVGEQELGILLLFPQFDLTSLKYLNHMDNFTYMFFIFQSLINSQKAF